MAKGDVQIAIPNGGAPTSRDVVGRTAIVPKAINGKFDGSGAVGPFLPCLVITGKEGFELARIPAPQVAAGASAEVSWFPRVGGGSSAAPTPATASETLSSHATVSILGGPTELPWDHDAGSNLLDLTNPLIPKMITAGLYAISVTAIVSPPMNPAAAYRLHLFQFFPGSNVVQSVVATASDPQPEAAATIVHHFFAGQRLGATILNFDSVARDFAIFQADVQRIS